MKIRKMFKANNFSNHFIIQKINGEYASFLASPFRQVTEKELRRLPYFTPVGKNEEEAEAYLYSFYGFKKVPE